MATAYELLEKSKKKQQEAINAQEQQQSQEKADREALAKKTLESSNRGVYTTYKNAINPYGANASQNNFATGTSEYMKNAAYGTMLQGLGANQLNYTTEIQNSNSLWQDWLAEKAGQEADIESAYNDAVIAQQNYEKELAKSTSGGSSYTGTNISDTEPATGHQSAESINKYMNTEYTGSTASDKGFGAKSGYTTTPYTYTTNETINGVKYRSTYRVVPGKDKELVSRTKA